MISIVIPCYNHNVEVRKAVVSAKALKPCGEEVEIILVDDGSKIPVEDMDGVQVIHHDGNKGLSVALNTGIQASHGDRFLILAADDELAPDFLVETAKYDADVVSVDMKVGKEHIASMPGSLEHLKVHNCHSYAALTKRWLFEVTGGFKTTMNPSWEDYEFWFNCAKQGAKWKHISLPLHIYNRNPKGRDEESQGKDIMLRGKLEGYHQDVFGSGRGVVAFIIPCYKHEKFLKFAVGTATSQVYPHTVAVIVDDGSPTFDDLEWQTHYQFLEPYAEGRWRIIHKTNGGLASARNAGIEFAIREWNPQYLVMLDADDEVDAWFVENTMAAMQKAKKEFIYTDLKFIGDAWHEHDLENFDCKVLVNKHLHPCTFLAHSAMYRAVYERRGYCYDESTTMKIGYEDWEFSIAAIEAGWCGKRLPEHLFHYRYHEGGSMRTKAKPHAEALLRYIRSKHTWMITEGGVEQMCAQCCGQGPVINRRTGKMATQQIGEVGLDEPILVRYTGQTTSTMTKIGAGQRIYKYSGNPDNTYGPIFTVMGCDIHLFQGPFEFKRVTESMASMTPPLPTVSEDALAPEPSLSLSSQQAMTSVDSMIPKPEEISSWSQDAENSAFARPTPEEVEQRLNATPEIIQDDFTILGLSEEQAAKLVQAGFSLYDDIASANDTELMLTLGTSYQAVGKLKDIAQKVVKAIAEEG